MFNPATVYQTKKRTVKIQFIQMFITMVTYELQQKNIRCQPICFHAVGHMNKFFGG